MGARDLTAALLPVLERVLAIGAFGRVLHYTSDRTHPPRVNCKASSEVSLTAACTG